MDDVEEIAESRGLSGPLALDVVDQAFEHPLDPQALVRADVVELDRRDLRLKPFGDKFGKNVPWTTNFACEDLFQREALILVNRIVQIQPHYPITLMHLRW